MRKKISKPVHDEPIPEEILECAFGVADCAIVHTWIGDIPSHSVTKGCRVMTMCGEKIIGKRYVSSKDMPMIQIETEHCQVFVSDNQPVFVVNKGYLNASDLKTGMIVRTYQEFRSINEPIVRITKHDTPMPCRSFLVYDEHEFFAGKILVKGQ